MRTGRPMPALILSPEERGTLEQWARRFKTTEALAQRARIILLCTSAQTNSAVAEKMRLTQQCVGKWRSRFMTKRLDGLFDEPRPGAPRTINDAKVERVIALTLESTPGHPLERAFDGQTLWSEPYERPSYLACFCPAASS
jgi:hypothetical protein